MVKQDDESKAKHDALARAHTLNPRPDQVKDALFRDNAFFDARDGVQVKYEMLRRVRVDGHDVTQAAADFGVSRPTYYVASAAFEREGLLGLLPAKKGPKRSHKLTPEVLAFVGSELIVTPGLSAAELVSRIQTRFGFTVHPKSLGRVLSQEKKTPSTRNARASPSGPTPSD